MLWDRTYSFLSLYEKTRKSSHLQMSFTKAALSSQLFKDPEGWPSWPGVETMTSCSADWRSPNWDNQGAVKFITNPPKKTCMQATKAMTGFLSLAFLWIWTQVKCANMPIVINGIANVLVTSDLLSQQYPAWWCQRLYGGSIYSVTRMFHNYSCLVSYLISKL